MKNDRQHIRRIVRSLLDKTVVNGCTEAEAAAAMEKAVELMEAHGLSPDEVGKSDFEELFTHTQGRAGPQDVVWGCIANITRCALMFAAGDGPRRAHYLGRQPWPDIACYLHEVCLAVMNRGLKTFRASLEYRRLRTAKSRAAARKAFLEGQAERLVTHLLAYGKRMGLPTAPELLEAREELLRRYPESSAYRKPASAGGNERARRYRERGRELAADEVINPGTVGRKPVALLTEA